MKNRFVVLSFSLGVITHNAFAGLMGQTHSDSCWVGTISLGPVWEDGGRIQTLNLAPDIIKTYTANSSSNAVLHGELFLGMQKNFSPLVQGQIGIAGAATSDASLSGHIWDDADPLFDNFTYGYKIQHSHISLKGKLLSDLGYWVIPWVSASVGVGFNNAHSYHNTPLIFEALPNPNFDSKTQTAFSYTVGAGIQKNLNAHWQMGAGYEFADWGKSSLGKAPGQSLNTGLSLKHLYTNGILFNLTYLS